MTWKMKRQVQQTLARKKLSQMTQYTSLKDT